MKVESILSLSLSLTKSYRYICHIRWKGRKYCLRCKYRKLYYLANSKYKCRRCHYKFSDFTGTYLQNIKIPFNILLYLIHLFVLGVPAYRIRSQLALSLKTIQRIFRLIRQSIYDQAEQELRKLSGELEMDETTFGGRRKGGKRGWGAEGKHIVFGIYQRNGKVIVFPVKNRDEWNIMPLVERYTQKGSIYYTDEWHGYLALIVRGKHIRISKEQGRPTGIYNLNGLEGFWSYAKHWLYHYRGVPRKYFHLYLKEIEFRFNNRNLDLFSDIIKLLTNLVPTS